jgi:hypothetical protein
VKRVSPRNGGEKDEANRKEAGRPQSGVMVMILEDLIMLMAFACHNI